MSPETVPFAITLRAVADPDALEPAWRALEAQAEGSFFQGWTWTGCLARERYSDPVVLEARRDGGVVALALFNRRASPLAPATLWLGETGDARHDAVFVEHNAPLLARGAEDALGACLAAALGARLPRGKRHGRAVVMSGIGDAVLAAARAGPGTCLVRRSRPAPFVTLGEQDYLAGLGSSTRYQLRRSERLYAAAGAVTVRRAADIGEALAMLEAMARLHQATWTERGKPGAFADPGFVRFHQALLARGVPRGEVDLLHIGAGAATIGYLYNFVWRGWVGNYQGGFDYAAADQHQKPGLTCHHAAIEFYRRQRKHTYDFLAGEDRYKTSLAQAKQTLHWAELLPNWSLRRLGLATKARLHRLVTATRR